MKINVKDETGVAVFEMFDGLVQELASGACSILSGMVRCLLPVFP